MSLLDSSVGLIYSLKADTDDAEKGLKKFSSEVDSESKKIEDRGKNAFNSLAQSIGLSAEQTATLSTVLPIAGAAIAAIAGATVGAAVGLFSLAKSASDYGSAIKDISDKTGIGAETISTLKLAADQSGSSIEAISGSVSKFSKLIGSAAEGSKEAKDSLIRLGLDPKVALNDLNGSLEKVFKSIYEAKNPIVATKLATEAFGKSGSDLIPVIKQMNGDFAAFKAEAEKLGVVLSDADVQAADDFGDTLTALKSQASATAFQFAKEFMPEITSGMQSISKYLSENKESWKTWGKETGTYIRGVMELWKEFYSSLPSGTGDAIKGALLGAGGAAFVNYVYEKGNTAQQQVPNILPNLTDAPNPNGNQDAGDYLADQQEAEKAAKEQLAAQEKLNKAMQDSVSQAFEELQRITKANYEARFITGEKYRADTLENERVFTQRLVQLTSDSFDQQIAREQNKTTQNALVIQKRTALEKIQEASAKRVEDANKLVIDSEKKVTDENQKEADKRIKISEDEISRKLELGRAESATALAALKERFRNNEITEREFIERRQLIAFDDYQFEAKAIVGRFNLIKGDRDKEKQILYERAVLNEKYKETTIANGTELAEFDETDAAKWVERELERIAILEKRLELEKQIADEKLKQTAAPAPSGTPPEHNSIGIDDLFGLSDETIDSVTGKVNVLKGVFDGLRVSVVSAAQGMTQALGSAIEGYLLYGNSIGKALKQAAAAELAHIASVSAIKAIYQLAEGFAALFTNPAAAAAHFQAAALYGAVAIGSGVAAKALAGNRSDNAFQRESSRGFASNSNSGGRSSGGAYSGDDVRVINQGINSAAGRGGEMVLTINDKSDWFDQMFDVAYHGNGKMRQILKKNYGT